MTQTPVQVTNLPYPQTKLRISASYRPAKVGDLAVEGQPENVEIELNELPQGDLATFITELVDSLFRDYEVTTEMQAGDPAGPAAANPVTEVAA